MRDYGWREYATALAVAAAYYGGAKLGLALTFSPLPISVLWPPNSILLAALLIAPLRLWWLILAAAFPAHLLAELGGEVPAAMVLCWYASNVAEALIGACGVRLLLRKPALTFDSVHDVGIFVLCCAFAGPFLSSFLDAAFVTLVGWGDSGYWDLWHARFFANVLTAITIVPFILAWAVTGLADMRAAPLVRHVEGAAMMGGLLVAGILVFNAAPGGIPPGALYLPLPFLLWAALRFGPSGASASMLIFTLLAIWGASHGRGPFVTSDPHASVLSLQMFLTFVAATLLVLAAALEERGTSARLLRSNEERLAHLSRLAVVGELTASVAHEINQPLGAILSNADAAEILLGRETVPVEELRQIIEDIRRDDMRAGEVIRHMRALLRRRELTMTPLDLNRAIGDVLGLVNADLGRRRVSVESNFGPLPMVLGDQVHLQQVVLNLILNGVDAMVAVPDGRRRLGIRTARRDAGVEIVVMDSGPGISADDARHLFDSFFTTKPSGLGLGLSIARSIVEAHGGTIRAESRPEGGASFSVFLPGQAGGTPRPGGMFGGGHP